MGFYFPFGEMAFAPEGVVHLHPTRTSSFSARERQISGFGLESPSHSTIKLRELFFQADGHQFRLVAAPHYSYNHSLISFQIEAHYREMSQVIARHCDPRDIYTRR
ncbi:hypothetical protein [Occallatibacter savannae]|uniref:hypothetical protein n=1 Tax=Occallatibacter savannae TaxID=1002691 RepID=UPI0013A58824|nr:hypothetical protein [Occallatibacter savannae]